MVVSLLKYFLHFFELDLNWDKNLAYSHGVLHLKPQWLRKRRWKWAIEGELSKLLGISFGLNLEVQDLDFLLIDKIQKKIKYQSTIHLSIIGTNIIVNLMFVFLWFLKSQCGLTQFLKIRSVMQSLETTFGVAMNTLQDLRYMLR